MIGVQVLSESPFRQCAGKPGNPLPLEGRDRVFEQRPTDHRALLSLEERWSGRPEAAGAKPVVLTIYRAKLVQEEHRTRTAEAGGRNTVP
jgi:hypothetical protein